MYDVVRKPPSGPVGGKSPTWSRPGGGVSVVGSRCHTPFLKYRMCQPDESQNHDLNACVEVDGTLPTLEPKPLVVAVVGPDPKALDALALAGAPKPKALVFGRAVVLAGTPNVNVPNGRDGGAAFAAGAKPKPNGVVGVDVGAKVPKLFGRMPKPLVDVENGLWLDALPALL